MRVVFSEPVDARGSLVAVLDTAGRRVDLDDTTADGSDALRVTTREVGRGGYVVAWSALSAVDGHTTRGSFVFAVGDAPLPALPDVGEVSPPPRPLEIAGRAIAFLGMAVLIGGALFTMAVRRRPGEDEERREQILFGVGAAMLVVGAVALLLEQGGRAPPRLTTLLTGRGLAGVIVLAAAAATTPRRLRPIALAAGVAAALTVTFVSHAAASGTPQGMVIDLVHTISASAWAGAVVAILAVTLPSAAALGHAELGRIVGRFSTFAVITVAVIVLTGVMQSVQRLVLVQDLWETPYGIAVLAKILLLAAALALAALNLLRWGPWIRAARDADHARRRLGQGVAGETAAIVLILVATAVLTALVPPAQASGAAFQATRHADGMRMQLLLASASPGQNRYVLRVSDGPAPVTDALRVAFRFTMIEHDMGESEIVADQRAPGEYVANGNVTAMFGTWRIEALVRRPERADVRTTFEVPIAAPTGPGAVARVVQAPPYTMVVYVDPIQPIAGAPVILNVVLVDARGDPVAGKLLRVTFTGPGTEAVDATEVSVGRYDAAVSALGAGRWTARIEIGSEARGEYAFDVAR